jgi:ubiquinone/menaquinone biosynthesis C-methylase UbiE
MSVTFDPVQFKTTTRAQWESAAEAWHRWGPTIEAWLGPATETMLDDAGVTPGSRVLDVAAGAGGQTLLAARRVGPTGKVLATDISPAILECAEQAARAAGLSNISTLEADGEDLSAVEEGAYDSAISRVGLIYFPDQQAALAGMCRALRPGGRVSASSTRRRTATPSSRSPSESSAVGPSSRRLLRDSRARSASAPPESPRRCSPRPG